MPCAIAPCKAASMPRDVAAVGVFIVRCARLCVVVFMSLFRVAYVWTHGRVWSRGQKRRDARSSWRIAHFCLRVRVCLCENDCRVVVPLVSRVSLCYVVLAKCSRVAFAWSRKRRGLHAFALLRTRGCRVYITVFV